MTIRHRKSIKQTAARRISHASYKPRRLILIHSGVSLGAALLMAILNYIITWQIDANGGGLSGIQLRSILDTAGMVLQAAYTILMPFWTMGLTYAALRLSRGKAAYPQALLEGFGRRGPVLRFVLMELLIYSIIAFAAMYGAYFLYSMTPDGQAFTEAVMKLMQTENFETSQQLIAAIPEPVMEQVARVYLPIFGVVLLVLVVPAAYRLRMAPYVLMDKSGTGAWKAIRTSGRITRRNCLKLLALDLSYWWYYLIPVLLMLPAYANALLPLVGVELPVDAAVIYMAGNVIYVVLTLIFECLAKPRVMTVYALAYDALLEQYQASQPCPVTANPDAESYGKEVR